MTGAGGKPVDQMPGCVIEPPLVLANAEDITWHDRAEVVVVGLGAAGASAAIEARDSGAEVLILDRFEGGGATRWSGGIVYAGGTRYQREAGKEDTADEMFKYLLQEVHEAARPETLRRFCEDSNANVKWLEAQGIGFEGSLHAGKTTFPPEDKYLYYSGNEKVPNYAAVAKPAPRGHRVVGKGWTGYVIAERLKSAAMKGTRQLFHSRVVRLVQDERGHVVGLEVLRIPPAHQAAHQVLFDKMDPMRPFGAAKAEKLVAAARRLEAAHGQRIMVRASRAVILACGGFAYNIEMVRGTMPAIADTFRTLIRMSALSCDGSGIQLGQSVGGASGWMDKPFLGRLIAPPEATIKGIIVNRQGRRFINEDCYNNDLGRAIAAQPGAAAWLIVDKATFRLILRQALQMGEGTFKNFGMPTLLNLAFGGTKKAGTLGGIEQKCGLPAGSLERTVAELNDARAKGQPDPLGKAEENFAAVGAGPYRAINTAVANVFSFMPFFTLGGLLLDQATGQVMGTGGAPVGGLYAAGRTAVGLCSDGYLSGMSIADCVFSGRRAGRSCT